VRTGRGKGDMNTTFLYGVFRTRRGSYASLIHPCIHAGSLTLYTVTVINLLKVVDTE